ncbi:MAG TPA: hypothetical protein VHI52_16415, partial [Verrucomicrobiae bacterium]|nr:hypothetical protein [Verrucomicrobiae bacterium]
GVALMHPPSPRTAGAPARGFHGRSRASCLTTAEQSSEFRHFSNDDALPFQVGCDPLRCLHRLRRFAPTGASALLLICGLLVGGAASGQASTASIVVDFSDKVGPMQIDHMALGQGGLSDEPMWANRVPEIRALHPALVRLFVQEYFELLPRKDHYHFATLDRSVETILEAGAKPLMCICFKPRLLFPELNQDVVEPTSYDDWDKLIFEMVRHYQQRHAGIQYWEIGNEPDIGEDGGCPYRFQPASYLRYYEHTARAILRADPQAHVGGPALANSRSPILPALLRGCQTNHIPLHFVSWHIYSSEPGSIRDTINYVAGLLRRYAGPQPETILDEWNMDLMNPPLDPRFQPCFIPEVIWQMKEGGLDYSCYYHIRDWYVSLEQFAPFMSPQGAAFMTRWWNRMPQFDGLFDYQDQVRPAYFSFKLLSRLSAERLRLTSDRPDVHGFASHDPRLRMHNLLLWNFSTNSFHAEITLKSLPQNARYRHIRLDAQTASSDENHRLVPEPFTNLSRDNARLTVELGPYAVHYWSME